MEPMDRVTFVQGMFCGVLLTVLGAAVFGPGHHGAVGHDTEPTVTPAAAEQRHVEVTAPHAMAAAQTRELTWSGYDGTGDPTQAGYALDGKTLGTGEVGLTALRETISRLPAGSTVRVPTYYPPAPAGGVRKRYPFDVEQLKKLAEDHHVTLAMPSAG